MLAIISAGHLLSRFAVVVMEMWGPNLIDNYIDPIPYMKRHGFIPAWRKMYDAEINFDKADYAGQANILFLNTKRLDEFENVKSDEDWNWWFKILEWDEPEF